MIVQVFLVTAAAVVMAAAALLGLYLVFRGQMRRYDRVAGSDLLDEWQRSLQALRPPERREAELNPPADVLAAMAMLPSPRRGERRPRTGAGH